ncbi:MAG TPA: PilN domain-containing protein [Gammaproteobacteria bacterium]|jgi:Tfp pilus assembly protein PilN|nr:PilN domain-containing protein [Gammaproteobacteria bacterium]
MMLRQEINLYRKFAPPPTLAAILTWRRLWGIYALMAILFLVIYLASLWSVHFLKVEKKELTEKVALLASDFAALKKNYPTVIFSQDFQQSIEKLSKELSSENKELEGMVQQRKFSNTLLALSHAIVPDVWLTQIKVMENGAKISLIGNSLSQGALQQFFSNLSKESQFSQAAISIEKIENADKKISEKLSFDIIIANKKYEHHFYTI